MTPEQETLPMTTNARLAAACFHLTANYCAPVPSQFWSSPRFMERANTFLPDGEDAFTALGTERACALDTLAMTGCLDSAVDDVSDMPFLISPVTVIVRSSEAGRAFAKGGIFYFHEFERLANQYADEHARNGGGYLKTDCTVVFSDGSLYRLRLDLGASERGFRHGIEQRLRRFNEVFAERRAKQDGPAEFLDEWEAAHAIWVRILWRDPAPLTDADVLAAFETVATPIGDQYVIPGCTKYQPRPARPGEQMNLFAQGAL